MEEGTSMFLVQWSRQGLGEQVSAVVLLGRDAEELHCPLGHPISMSRVYRTIIFTHTHLLCCVALLSVMSVPLTHSEFELTCCQRARQQVTT
eukprot:4482262-Pyramimonas_sp.AAC.1